MGKACFDRWYLLMVPTVSKFFFQESLEIIYLRHFQAHTSSLQLFQGQQSLFLGRTGHCHCPEKDYQRLQELMVIFSRLCGNCLN